MTQANIRDAYKWAMADVNKANADLHVAQAKLRAVQMQCAHPDKFKTCTMGESCEYCPDCGWSS